MLDLVKSGLNPENDRVVILLPSGEVDQELDSTLQAIDQVSVDRWTLEDETVSFSNIADSTTHLFIVLDGDLNPVEQLEPLRDYLADCEDIELARIITVVDSGLLFQKPEIEAWYDACVHFSDVILFNRREDVPNKWFSDYQQRFKKLCYPALFDNVKKGRVRNPAEILYPEPRRMTQAFDFDLDDTQDSSFGDLELVQEFDEDEDDVVEDDATDELGDDVIVEDPFFERNLGGQRIKRIPDIRALRAGE